MNRWWLSYGVALAYLGWLCQDGWVAVQHDPQNRWLWLAALVWFGAWLSWAAPALVRSTWQPALGWLGGGLALGTMGWMGSLNFLQHMGLSLVLVSALPTGRARLWFALCSWVVWPALGWGLSRWGMPELLRLLPLFALVFLAWPPMTKKQAVAPPQT